MTEEQDIKNDDHAIKRELDNLSWLMHETGKSHAVKGYSACASQYSSNPDYMNGYGQGLKAKRAAND